MTTPSNVRDGFEVYYTEKLWRLVPEFYRHEDESAEAKGVLRQIIEVIAADAAMARRSIDRLWEDQHIETCDDWAVPYIGDLVGTRLVSIADRRARRVDVANSIHYRRRRGTPGLLRELVRSISGWDLLLVEGFQRLARMHHRLSPIPTPRGVFTATLPGGTADLRTAGGAELAPTAFTEFFHTLDVRRLLGRDGQFGIRKLNFHLYREQAYVIEGSELVELAASDPQEKRAFAIDPSGRDIPLFIDAEVAEDLCAVTHEWDITQAMRCRLLGHAAYSISASHLSELSALPAPPLGVDLDAMRRVLRTRFASETDLRRRLSEFGAVIGPTPPAWYRRLVELALVEPSGKFQLYPRQVEVMLGGVALTTAEIAAGDLSERDCQPELVGKLARVLISPELGRLATIPAGTTGDAAPLILRYVYGFSGDVGAGPYVRTLGGVTARTASAGSIPDGGVLQGDGLTCADNRSYDLSILSSTVVGSARLQAESGRRPLVRLHGNPGNPHGANLLPAAEGQTFVADGGWYLSSAPEAVPGVDTDFVVEGLGSADTATFDFDRFELRNLTLDPGGKRADGSRIAPLRLLVRGQIRRLIIKRSITGPIIVAPATNDPLARVEQLIVCDSIVDATQTEDGAGIVNALGEVVMEGSTVFGDVVAGVLWANASIISGKVVVANNQDGCFRFSACSPSASERLPPRYRDVRVAIVPAFFNSRRFGDPDYAQLSIVAPESIARGAENRSEMGAFSHLLAPIRLDSVKTKIDEFAPAGVLAQFLFAAARSAETFGPNASVPPASNTPPSPPPQPGPVIPTPPPEPPPPLPTRCPDDDGTDSGPIILRVDVNGADLGGAPTFWREADWTGSLALPGESARVVSGIPFDRVTHLVEFDARFGRAPAAGGWHFETSAGRAGFVFQKGALSFAVPSAAAAGFAQALIERLEGNTPIVHAYGMVRLAPSSGDGSRVTADDAELGAGFGLGIARLEHGKTVGLRARLDSPTVSTATSAAGEIHLASSHWASFSLQADFESEFGIVSHNDRIEPARVGPLAAIGCEPGGPADTTSRAESLWAFFGVQRAGVAAQGELRNFVASSPGRFIRAWFALRSPSARPRVRLAFTGAAASSGVVQVRLRYGTRSVGSAAVELPTHEILARLELAQGTGAIEVELHEVSADEALWLTVERDSFAKHDDYPATARLLDLTLIAHEGAT